MLGGGDGEISKLRVRETRPSGRVVVGAPGLGLIDVDSSEDRATAVPTDVTLIIKLMLRWSPIGESGLCCTRESVVLGSRGVVSRRRH